MFSTDPPYTLGLAVISKSRINDKALLFIIGSGRSGTTWLQTMLGEHPNVATTTEMSTFHGYVGPMMRTWDREKKNYEEHVEKQENIESDEGMIGGLSVLWSESEFLDFVEHFLEITYDKYLHKNPRATHILEKDQRISLFVDIVNRFHKDAKFIHLLRDGRDVACSRLATRIRAGFGQFSVEEAAGEWKKYVLAAKTAESFGPNSVSVREPSPS